jgi:malate synthase
LTDRVVSHRLQIASTLHRFINEEALPGTGIDVDAFWKGVDTLIHDLAPKNRLLLAERDRLQLEIDAWHEAHSGPISDPSDYRSLLESIGYLQPVPDAVCITTANVDAAIAEQAGPQLVVPVMNARFAINAANARWGSLYDALYGTDAISEDGGATRAGGYNPIRGARVIAFARNFLDRAAPLSSGSHHDAAGYKVADGALQVTLHDGSTRDLKLAGQFLGWQGDAAAPKAVLLKHHGLHFEIQIDANSPVGKTDAAGVKDVLMEAALTTIMDCEDSVAAVDADDKVLVYRNWLGLMKGDLVETFDKGGETVSRHLNPDRVYDAPGGGTISVPGRSLLLIRNVGHHMYTDAVLDAQGHEIPEGILDCAITDRGARRAWPGPLTQQPRGFDLHRQAEDARAGGSRLRRHAVRPRRGSAEPAAQHHQDRHHGRGTAHQRQPQGLHRRRAAPAGVHQYRLPGPHRRRDPHLDRSRPDDT